MLVTLLQLIDSPEDKRRFEQLYYEYRNLMFYFAKGMLGSDRAAEDAVSEAFIRIIKHFHDFDEIICPRTKNYIVLVVKSVCIDMLRKKSREPQFVMAEDAEGLMDLATPVESGEEEMFRRYDMDRIIEAIHGLPEIYKTTLMLYAVRDESLTEIAEHMGCGKETVKKRLYRARRELRKRLEVQDGRE